MNPLSFLVFFAVIALAMGDRKHGDDHLDLDAAEQDIFNRFKVLAAKDLEGQTGFAKSDIFLVRFLRARGFQLLQAHEMLQKHFQWKKENHIEGIQDEDWTHMMHDYPFYVDAVDKRGRPLLYFPIGPSWNVTAAMQQGHIEELVRYGTIKSFDMATRLAYNSSHTRFLIVADMNGFTVEDHLCGFPMCLGFYGDFLKVYEENYPEWPYRIIVVNAPPAFDLVLKFIKPFMSKNTVDCLKVYGPKKIEWSRDLFSHAAKDQLSMDLGGTRKYGNVPNESKKEDPLFAF